MVQKRSEKKAAKKKEESKNRERIIELKGLLSLKILSELEDEELCGEELAERIGTPDNSSKPLTPGTIYPTLKKLRQKRLVRRRIEGRKKYYRLTKGGKEELAKGEEIFKKYFKKIIKKIEAEIEKKKGEEERKAEKKEKKKRK